MAGGKVGPRQKMINMMYLVLTALLALNVSAEILSAFETIKEQLNYSSQNAEASATGAIKVMKAKVDEEVAKGQKDNAGVKDSLDIVHNMTKDLITYIDGLDKSLLAMDGVQDPKTGEILRKDETELNHNFFMGAGGGEEQNGGRGAGKAFELRNKINAYYKTLMDIHNLGTTVDTAKWKAAEFTIQDQKAEDGQAVTWEKHTFHGPIVANFAMLEALKADIYQKENKLLNDYAARLGMKPREIPPPTPPIEKPKIEEKKPDEKPVEQKKPETAQVKCLDGEATLMISPVSEVVVAGMQYKAKLIVGVKAKETFKYTTTAGSISGDDVIIPANGNAIPAGKTEVEQSYTVSTTVQGKSLSTSGKFKIRKPEIVVTSASVQNLYRLCGNMVNIDVPALGDLYNPVCTASDAEIKQSGESKKKFLIVPRGNKCIVGVSSLMNGQTMKIGDVVYNVIDPPKPSIEILINGQRASSSTQVAKGSRVTLKVVPDPEFKAALPQDARYEITAVAVYKQCGLNPPSKAGGTKLSGRDAAAGLDFPIPQEAFQCSSGSKIFFEVEDVARKNFQSKIVVDPRFTLYEKSISVTTK